jgi:hypothetical protein
MMLYAFALAVAGMAPLIVGLWVAACDLSALINMKGARE